MMSVQLRKEVEAFLSLPAALRRVVGLPINVEIAVRSCMSCDRISGCAHNNQPRLSVYGKAA